MINFCFLLIFVGSFHHFSSHSELILNFPDIIQVSNTKDVFAEMSRYLNLTSSCVKWNFSVVWEHFSGQERRFKILDIATEIERCGFKKLGFMRNSCVKACLLKEIINFVHLSFLCLIRTPSTIKNEKFVKFLL